MMANRGRPQKKALVGAVSGAYLEGVRTNPFQMLGNGGIGNERNEQ